ncbi:MAG: aminotransferase class IV [Chloroflexi bacterium]|nr:aminotransferase class IV [Chloroflexota bacterium]
MTAEIIYVNGHLLPKDQAGVSVLDQGFLYGYGLFETMRAYQGRVFRMADHLARLIHSGEEIGILLGGQSESLKQAIEATLHANQLEEARVRLTVTAGQTSEGPMLPAPGPYTTVVTVSGVEPLSQGAYEDGFQVVVASRRRTSMAMVARMKSTSFLGNLMAKAEARRTGAHEALILNERACAAECSMANIFFVMGGRLMTPSHDCGLLRGITREAVLALAKDLGIPIERAWIPLERVREATEIFVTSSVLELMPVTSLDGRKVGNGTPGETTRLLTSAYRSLVHRELGLTL